jgi:hypothetical protein
MSENLSAEQVKDKHGSSLPADVGPLPLVTQLAHDHLSVVDHFQGSVCEVEGTR